MFGGHNIIAENGTMLAVSERFGHQTIYADLDLLRLNSERRRMTTYGQLTPEQLETYQTAHFSLQPETFELKRFIDPSPDVYKRQVLSWDSWSLGLPSKRTEAVSMTTTFPP